MWGNDLGRKRHDHHSTPYACWSHRRPRHHRFSAPRFGRGPYRQDFPSVSRRHDRRRAISATACAASSRAELEKRTNGVDRRAGLSQLVADEDRARSSRPCAKARSTSASIRSPTPAASLPRLNIGLMPGLVSSYKQGAAWKKAPVGQEVQRVPRREGRRSWCRGSGRPAAVASRGKPIVNPEDAKGMKIRGGSREMDMMLQGGRRHHAVDAVERALCGDADRRLRRGAHLLDQPDLVPAGGGRQEPHQRAAASPTGSCSSR